MLPGKHEEIIIAKSLVRDELCDHYGDIMQTQPQAQSLLSRKVGVDEEGAAQNEWPSPSPF